MTGQKTQMQRDVARIARIVAAEMGIRGGMQSTDCFYLCDRAGGAARQVILPEGTSGLFTEDREPGYDIFISLSIPIWTIPIVMIHELTHRFTCSVHSRRYDDLNSPRLARYDRTEFHEAVALHVERLFLYACYLGAPSR
jgi:hypothetical protein